MLIAQITDTHIGFDPGNPDESNLHRLNALLRRLAEGPNRPDALLLTGDLTEFGDAESYARLAAAVAGMPFPVWPMAGNHDDRAPLLAAFPQAPAEGGFVQYPLEWDHFRVLLLDTLEPGRHGGGFCAARAGWLAGQLAARPGVPTLIAMHHPPFESGIAWLDGDEHEEWIARFAATVAGHDQVKAIVSGHLHRAISTLWNGVPATVCASSAAAAALDLRPVDPESPDGRAMIVDELPGYALHRWDGRRIVSHCEAVGALTPLARYDERFQPVIRQIESERPA